MTEAYLDRVCAVYASMNGVVVTPEKRAFIADYLASVGPVVDDYVPLSERSTPVMHRNGYSREATPDDDY